MTPPKKKRASEEDVKEIKIENNTTPFSSSANAVIGASQPTTSTSTSPSKNHKKVKKHKKKKKESADEDAISRKNNEAAAAAMMTGTPVDFLYKTMLERDPRKRKVKPVDHKNFEALLLEDSSSDESYKPKGEEEDDFDDEEDDDSAAGGDSDDDEDEDDSQSQDNEDSQDVVDIDALMTSGGSQRNQQDLSSRINSIRVCAVCCGDVSVDADEIIECDSCSITVHENCYGVDEDCNETANDSDSVHSTLSSASTEPWFCDACQAGVKDVSCELCPNPGGIFKRTDAGRWVHLVCALYTNGVAFADTIHLTGITLFELPVERWGCKACSICEDERFARTGVTISCDAGLCRTHFHVTCAQREGLLQEVQELDTETEIVDPFVAHCKVHAVQKHIVKSKKRNFLSLRSRMKFKSNSRINLTSRTQKKLDRARDKWKKRHHLGSTPLPTPIHSPLKKIPRLLTTCPAAVKMLIKKADLMGFPSSQVITSHHDSLDIRKKWHVPPAFSAEFVSYFIDRSSRIQSLKNKLSDLKRQDESLKRDEGETSQRLNQVISNYDALKKSSLEVINRARNFWSKLSYCSLSPSKGNLNNNNSSNIIPVRYPKVFETPAKNNNKSFTATSNGVMSSVNNNLMPSTMSSLSKRLKGRHVKSLNFNSSANQSLEFVLKECGICHELRDQHLLTLCDRCRLYYHLDCLDPPLTRMPKKTRFGGWQCSDCTDKLRTQQLYQYDPLLSINNEDPSTEDKRRRKEPSKFVPESEKKHKEKFKKQKLGKKTTTAISTFSADGSQVVIQKRRGRPPLSEKEKMRRVIMKEKLKQMKLIQKNNKKLVKQGQQPIPIPEDVAQVVAEMQTKKSKATATSSSHPPGPEGDVAVDSNESNSMESNPLVVSSLPSSPLKMVIKKEKKEKIKKEAKPKRPYIRKVKVEEECCKCRQKSFTKDLVKCDDCKKLYHFPCLDPPAKKTPKVKGYKWFCPDCDQSSSESDSSSGEESSDDEEDGDEEDEEESEEQPKKTNGNRVDSSSDSDSYESADEAINLTKQK